MEPVWGAPLDASDPPDERSSPYIIFVDPSVPEYLWSSTIPSQVRSPYLMAIYGVASNWDLFGQFPVQLPWCDGWRAIRDDFNRVSADFHRSVLTGPHPPEQGTLFETAADS